MSQADAVNVLAELYTVPELANLTFAASDSWAVSRNPIENVSARTNLTFPESYVEGTIHH